MASERGRDKEARIIRIGRRAAAVGKLLLGEIREWNEFLEADSIDFGSIPRRELKSLYKHVRSDLSKRIEAFCSTNFRGMTKEMLSDLYEEIKAYRGLEIPLKTFQDCYCPVKPQVLSGYPAHVTLEISLWGLQFLYPEHLFERDIEESLHVARVANEDLKVHRRMSHQLVQKDRERIAGLVRKVECASRTCVLASFNLVEAYLNGLAWDFSKDQQEINLLSKKKRELIEDTGRTHLRDKVLKYPEIISGYPLWTDRDEPVKSFLGEIKVFRDSLVHPSPFSVPERFGGYDKLQMLYQINVKTAEQAAQSIYDIAIRVHHHVKGPTAPLLKWMIDLSKALTVNDDQDNSTT